MATTSKSDVRKAMAEWRDFSGMTPLASASSRYAVDRCAGHLNQANAILAVLSAACRDAQAKLGEGGESEVNNLNMDLLSGALDGVGSLIDLASFMLGD